jgi:carbon-monoxide dehydrogenase large subunit
VRFVGDPVACVIAETVAQAKDAADAVSLDFAPLRAVVRASEAIQASTPQIYEEVPGNIALDYHYGDTDKVAAAFAQAAHLTRVDLFASRSVVNATEPRSAIGEYEAATGKWTMHSCSQGVFGQKVALVDILGAPADKVCVLTGNVGGSFRMKAPIYPEYVCILHGARALGRPVKWTDERSGSFVSDHHGRDHEMRVELALDAAGHFLALRVTGYGNMDAFLGPFGPLLPTEILSRTYT